MKERETKKGRRISRILDGLNQGMSYPEIQKRLVPLKGEQRGEDSVKNVEEAIKNFPFIKEIKKTDKNSKEDTVDKHDLIILLSGKSIDKAGIQVKSSIQRCSKFRHKFFKEYDDNEKILIKKKLIVINGQLPEFVIQKIFINQLSKIDEYFKNSLSSKEATL